MTLQGGIQYATFTANGGNGARCGGCTPGTCYWWNALCACHQTNNWYGQGGNGGDITLRALNLNLGTFNVRGAMEELGNVVIISSVKLPTLPVYGE